MNIIKLVYTFKKTKLTFTEDDLDPFEKNVEEGMLPEKIQSHVDAIADYIVQEHKLKYEEDKKQIPLGFNDEEPEAGSDETDGYTADQAQSEGVPVEEEPENVHPSEIKVHYLGDTNVPDFTKIEDQHLEAWLQYRYAGDQGFDKKDLIDEIKYQYDSKIPGNLGTKGVVQAALKIIRGEV